MDQPISRRAAPAFSGFRILEAAVGLPATATAAVIAGSHNWVSEDWALLFWVVLIGIVEALPVPAWRDLRIGTAFPLVMAVAFLYEPELAFLVAFVSASDPREFRREIGPLRAVFNRGQIALATLGASVVFHNISQVADSNWQQLLLGAGLGAVTDYVINSSMVSFAGSLLYRMPILAVARKLRIGNPAEFLLSYVGLGVVGALLARLYLQNGEWAVALFLMPLLLARQMFFRSRALEEATSELKDREKVLEQLSNRMAEERLDERRQVADYLHDDLAQRLFRLGVHAEMARKHLEAGETAKADELLERIRADRDDASDTVRGLLRDLHTANVGRAGLSSALHAFTADLGGETPARLHVFVDELDLPASIQLLLYQIAREAVMNAIAHGAPTNVWISLREMPDDLRLEVRDDGKGFDPETEQPDGHYGLAIMRERAGLAGGTLRVDSAPGAGTKVTVSLSRSWLAPPDGADDGQSEPHLGHA